MTPLLKTAYSPETFRQQGHELVNMLADMLAGVQQNTAGPFFHMHEPGELYHFWQNKLSEPEKTAQSFFSALLSGSTNLQHPRNMGHQVAVTLPVTAIAGLFTNLLNNGMAVYEVGNAPSVMEKLVIRILSDALGYNEEAGGLLTSGGTLANLTALLTARAVVAGNDVWENGHSEPLALMVSEEAHYCVDRAVRVMGWGAKGIIKIPVDEQFRMRTDLLPEYLEQAKANGLRVIAVVGSACSTSTGAYDNLEAIATFCQKHKLWFHADGAHGSAVAFSTKHRHLIKGIEQADSVVTDFHKLMMVPGLATAVVYKNGAHAYKTFRQEAQYLWNRAAGSDDYNSGKKTYECTKLSMSVKILSAIYLYGTQVFTDYADTVHEHAQQFAQLVEAHPAFELAVPPQSNIVCFRYINNITDTETANHVNSAIRAQLLANGNYFIVQTTLKGKIYLRVSLMNPFTGVDDIQGLLAEAEAIGQQLKQFP